MKKPLKVYFRQYANSHQNKWNRLCHSLGMPMIIISLVLFALQYYTYGLILFVVGWAFQFLGHAIEKTPPEFITDPMFFIIGPLFFFNKIFKKIDY